MKVLILGATGLLGRAVHRELREHAIAVVGTGRRRAHGDILALDARNPHDVEALFAAVAPDVVLNVAGERRPEYWDGPQLSALNVALPQVIAERCTATGSWLIHLSSDYVFDGDQPPHTPTGRRRPLNPYGLSKADGEDAVRRACPSATILRVPVLHGPVEYPGESNLSSLIPQILTARPASIDDWATRYPTATSDVASTLRQMLHHAPVLRGQTCHWSATEGLTKYAMARVIAQTLDAPFGHLRPDRDPHPGRPRDPRLDCQFLEGLGIGSRTPLQDALPAVIASTLNQESTP